MTGDKKPDNVVFNTETKRYDASIKPYATSLGAPVIVTTDTTAWKNRSINKINHKIHTKYFELKNEYAKMISEFEYNQVIYNAKFNFEPVIGKVYHLYKRENDESFLSLIEPQECNFDFLGSFHLNVDQTWDKIEDLC